MYASSFNRVNGVCHYSYLAIFVEWGEICVDQFSPSLVSWPNFGKWGELRLMCSRTGRISSFHLYSGLRISPGAELNRLARLTPAMLSTIFWIFRSLTPPSNTTWFSILPIAWEVQLYLCTVGFTNSKRNVVKINRSWSEKTSCMMYLGRNLRLGRTLDILSFGIL